MLAATAAYADEIVESVARIHDGGTPTILVGREQHRISLSHIDAPELHQAFGKRSRPRIGSAHPRPRNLRWVPGEC